MINKEVQISKLYYQLINNKYNEQQNLNRICLIKSMTDPIQFIIDQQYIHKVLTHEGLLGKGRDFITGRPCSLHLYNDKFKKIYVMQQFDGVDQNFVSDKMTRITKTVHSQYMSNLTKVCFVSTRKNQKGLFDLCVFYDATGVYGYSLQFIIKMKIKNDEKFSQDEVIGFFWQICDFILLNGQYTGEFLEITPVNIFCKAQDYYGYNFFPNNFGLSFQNTKWQRKYHNPKDRFWNGDNTLEAALRACMFIFGMVLLELCCLLPPSDLYTDKLINQKLLKKRLQGIKLTTNPTLCQTIILLLKMNEDERITIKKIFENKELLRTRKVDHYSNKAGFYQYKAFEGVVSFDQKHAVGEALDQKMCLLRGKFEEGQLDGLCLRENDNQKIEIGIFEKGYFIQGTIIRKNDCIMIVSENGASKKGIMVKLNINMLKNEKKTVVAFEGDFYEQKPVHGTVYYSDGTQEQI